MRCIKCKKGHMLMNIHGFSSGLLGNSTGDVNTDYVCLNCGFSISNDFFRKLQKKYENNNKKPEKKKSLWEWLFSEL